ncbi:MAG: EAL domain-containing protein [Rhodocyclaceae bacterium]|nr:EAL domain-containing protein [Rhodocyclaceae bacterium]
MNPERDEADAAEGATPRNGSGASCPAFTPPVASPPLTAPIRVLVIEDSAADFALLEHHFRHEGLRTLCLRVAGEGELNEALRNGAWDVVISDYSVPGLIFEKTLARLGREYPLLPVILVSGSVGEERAVELLKQGARDFVLKDNLTRLVPALEQSLRHARDLRARQDAERSLADSESRLALALEASRMAVWEWDIADDLFYLSPACRTLLGLTDFDGCYASFLLALHPDDRARVEASTRRALEDHDTCNSEFRVVLPDGRIRWLANLGRAQYDAEGRPEKFIGTLHEVTERKHKEAQIVLAAQVFWSTLEGVIITDERLNIIAVNHAFTAITGYTEADILGQTPRLLRSGRHGDMFYQAMWAALNASGQWRGEIWNRRKFGEVFPELLTISSVRNEEGKVTNYVAVFSDISSSKAVQENLDFLAHHDALTGLPNRILFRARLEHSLQQARRDGRKLALLFVDLDRFKKVNDTLGHPVGDELLISVAAAMSKVVREGDTLARLGGDEFILLMEGLNEPQDAASVAGKLRDVFTQPFRVRGNALYVTASIGIALYPEDGLDPDTLISNADVSMYQAKAQGRNTYQFFESHMTQGALERLHLETALRGAMERGEFEVYYQPQVSLPTGHIEGAEALLRWHHPERGLVSPAEFIPIAEEIGLIGELGAWVLQAVCRQIQAWDAEGVHLPRVAVNLSVQQLERTGLVERVRRILEETGLDSSRIELEVTESMIMREAEHAIESLNGLKALGIRLAVDDFGTGYSSLAYLKRLPLHRLKIDRSFVHDLTVDDNDAAIARAIIAMAASLGLEVLAEGVETREQADFLAREGCHEVQGYFFSRPVTASQLSQIATQVDWQS